MRTSIDIPDALMTEIRIALSERGLTFREAVIEGLRRTLLDSPSDKTFELRDASFRGVVGFAPGFSDDSLTDALREDAEARLLAEQPGSYES